MSIIKEEHTEQFYKNEIRSILSKVYKSFKDEQIYNYDLYEKYDEVENEFKEIEFSSIPHDAMVALYEKAKSLLNI